MAAIEQSPGIVVPRLGGPLYVVGYRTSPHVLEYREFLERNGVPHEWIDIDNDPLARFLGAPEDVEGVRLPVFVFPDGSTLEPYEDPDESVSFARTRAELAVRAGLHARPELGAGSGSDHERRRRRADRGSIRSN